MTTAALFGAEHTEQLEWGHSFLLTLGSPEHGLRSQLAWIPSDVRAQRSALGDLALGHGPHLYEVSGLGLVIWVGGRAYRTRTF